MIPTQTLENYPLFGDNATKVTPDDAKRAAGFQQSDVLPAEWVNWAWNKNSKGITDLNSGVRSMEAELVAILTEAGITPSEATEGQVLAAINKINNKTHVITVDTSITPTGNMKYVMQANVTLTLGNSAVPPGTEMSVLVVAGGKITYRAITGSTVTDEVNGSRVLKYAYTGTAWLCSSAPEIGSIKKQYPDQDAPAKLYGGQWEEVSYGGAFERSTGGNAKTFQAAYEGVTIAGTNVTFPTSRRPTSTELAAGDIIIFGSEYREVSSYSTSSGIAVLKSAFSSSPNNATVIIGQCDTFQGHWHQTSLQWNGTLGGNAPMGDSNGYGGGYHKFTDTVIRQPTADTSNNYGTPRVSSETKPKNFTVKYWKRTN